MKTFKELKDMVELDIYGGYTPDLPTLRYQDMHLIMLFEDHKELRFVSKGVTLHNELVLLRNMNKVVSNNYMMRAKDVRFSDVEGASTAKGLKAMGNVYRVTTKQLQKLDKDNLNEFSRDRKEFKVTNPLKKSSDQFTVWSYFAPLSGVSKYDPHENCYKISKGLDLKINQPQLIGGEDMYKPFFNRVYH